MAVSEFNEPNARSLTVTYVSNSYVLSASGHFVVRAYLKGGVVYINGKMLITNDPPQASYITVGKVSLPKSLIQDTRLSIMATGRDLSDTGSGSVYIDTNGTIFLYKHIAWSWRGWVDFAIAVPLAN